MHADESLLAPDEPAAFRVEREQGQSPFFLTCDHAGALVPRRLNSLGVSAQDLQRHIAWDIGAAAVATKLAARLDAFLILQTWSRLVIDCNRPPGSEQSIVQLSETTRIPGNESILPVEALARSGRCFARTTIASAPSWIGARRSIGGPFSLLCTALPPCFHGTQRPWHVGLLYNRDPRLAGALLHALRADPDLVVGNNEPYSVSDSTDYTIRCMVNSRGLLHVGIEFRQDPHRRRSRATRMV